MRLKVSNVCQLYDKTYPATQTVNGVTFTNNGDGSVTVNGTAPTTKPALTNSPRVKVNPGDKILMFSGYDIGGLKSAFVYVSQLNANGKWIADLGYPSLNGRLATCSKNTHYIGPTFRVDPGNTATNAVIKLQIFNLTEMYGAGNEPTTVEQFRQDFPNEMYDYSPVCWKKFRRLKYVTETKNLFKFSNEVGTLTGSTGPNVARNFEEDKWYIGFTPNNYYIPNNIEKFSIKDNLIYLKRKANTSGYGLARAFRCEPNKTYTVSCGAVFTEVPNCIFTSYFDKDGNLLSFNNAVAATKTITTPANCSWLVLIFTFFNATNPSLPGETYIINPQLELGSTASPYQPYGYLPLNRGKYIANKEPVQLLDKSKFPATITKVGVTFTNNGDGTITLNGTNAGGGTNLYTFMSVSVKAGHYYYIYSGQAGTWETCIFTVNRSISADRVDGYIGFQPNSFDNCVAYLFIGEGATFNNYVVKPQFFDLTEMYGAGNEPKTVAQFRADFPNELYDYNPYNAITFR